MVEIHRDKWRYIEFVGLIEFVEINRDSLRHLEIDGDTLDRDS